MAKNIELNLTINIEKYTKKGEEFYRVTTTIEGEKPLVKDYTYDEVEKLEKEILKK